MAEKKQRPKVVSTTLDTGTKVTATQAVIDKLTGSSSSSGSTSRSSSSK